MNTVYIIAGNLTAALDTETLKKYHISHILSVDSKPLPTNITYIAGMKFLYIEGIVCNITLLLLLLLLLILNIMNIILKNV